MSSLKELLRIHFGNDFPVGEGSAKVDDPLVITDRRDYVSIEYAVSQHLLGRGGYEYKLDKQALHHRNGRAIDELVYASKPLGAPDWTETRRYFFDISAGLNNTGESLGQSLDEQLRGTKFDPEGPSHANGSSVLSPAASARNQELAQALKEELSRPRAPANSNELSFSKRLTMFLLVALVIWGTIFLASIK